MNYTALSLADIRNELEAIASDAQETFGALAATQLNWRADANRWSVGQCLEHLVTANDLMLRSSRDALRGPSGLWQRMPFLPGMFGPALIRSQAPGGTRKYRAPASAQPTKSDVAPDIVSRFVQQHHGIVDWVAALDGAAAMRSIMTSPFIPIVTYSVLDGARLLVAHDHRHIEQARGVMSSSGFPT